MLAGVGRTLETDAVDMIGDRFIQQPPTRQATVGGQAFTLEAIHRWGAGDKRREWRMT